MSPRHGTNSCYNAGCDRPECRAAHTDYSRTRMRNVRRASYGLEERVGDMVDPREAQAHLRWLARNGIGLRAIAHVTGLDRSTVALIRAGERTTIRRSTADKILGVGRSRIQRGSRVDAKRTRDLIADLVRFGYTKATIAAALGYRSRNLNLHHPTVTARNADAVEAVWRRLIRDTPQWHGQGPRATKTCPCVRCRDKRAERWQAYKNGREVAA